LVVIIGVISISSGTFWGTLSDRVSRDQAFFYSYVLQAIAFALMALSRESSASSLLPS